MGAEFGLPRGSQKLCTCHIDPRLLINSAELELMDSDEAQYHEVINSHSRKKSKPTLLTPEEELKKEMHRKCESVTFCLGK